MSDTSRSLHILIIPSWYPIYEGDIGGSFFREQAHALKKVGHKVGVIYPQVRSIKDVKGIYSKPYGQVYIDDEGIPTYRFHHLGVPKLHKVQYKIWIRFGLQLFKKYVAEFGVPDIIHVHSLKPAGLLALEIKSRYGTPFIVTEHSSAFARGLIPKSYINYFKQVVNSSSYNIAVSHQFCTLLNHIFNVDNWSYIPNIVNSNFTNFKSTASHSEKEFNYLSVCFLTKIKAIDNLIHAFSLIHKKTPNAILNIGGDGEERDNLEKLVKDLNLENKVVFLGSLSRERVKLEMAKSSVFVLPSRYETFGVVLIEALALGKPVIATRCGGPESIIDDTVGTLVAVDDIKQLSEAMLDSYINYDEYNPDDIKKYCVNNFSEEAVTSKLTEIYKSVLAGLNR